MDRLYTYNQRLVAEPSRVVIRPFDLAQAHDVAGDGGRVRRIVKAVLAMDPDECARVLDAVNADFATRHWQSQQVHLARFGRLAEDLKINGELTQEQRELIGAYFCHEYSYAAAAVMNPSIVPHIDQSGLRDGDQRFIMSLRSVGEGHISSVSFREGILKADGDLQLWPQPDLTISAESIGPIVDGEVAVRRPSTVPISGLVIFPFTPAQRNGLEDVRLVRFIEPDGSAVYYGTYTAYSGAAIQSEMMTTRDFSSFTLKPMSGQAARSKGLALFPRKVGGAYCMIGRQDGESVFFLESEDLNTWEDGELILAPKYPWELVQLGNCGSPIELDEGWLLLTHGVGAMRKYAIGAALLDKQNPRKVLGRLPAPFLSPSNENREGYVPNVLYTCGGMKHGDRLFLPFGIADSSISFAMVDLKALLAEMV